MGPRRFQRGYRCAHVGSVNVDVASMGPRRFQRGYVAMPAIGSGDVKALQWGHAVSSVDTQTHRERNRPQR